MTWSASAWVGGLRPGARLAWIELLGYVKAYGVGGSAKGLTASAAGRRWSIGPKDVAQMMNAALADGALRIEENGDWVVVNFGRYQEVDTTAAERMRKHRALRRNATNDSKENGGRVPRSDPLRRNSRNVRDVPSRDRDVDVDSDRDRTAGEHARARSAAPGVNGGNPDFDGYRPTEGQVARAAELQVDLTSALIKWRGNRKSSGSQSHDLVGDFDEWLEREPGYVNGSTPHAEPPAAVRQPVFRPDPEPEPSEESKAEGLRIVREVVKQLRPPMPPENLDDPARVEARAAERERQRRLLPKPGAP